MFNKDWVDYLSLGYFCAGILVNEQTTNFTFEQAANSWQVLKSHFYFIFSLPKKYVIYGFIIFEGRNSLG